MEPHEIVKVNRGDELSCDGGALYGHPRVYLTLGDEDHVDCYYCGRRYQAEPGAKDEGQSAA